MTYRTAVFHKSLFVFAESRSADQSAAWLECQNNAVYQVGGAVPADYPSGREPLTVGYCPDKLQAGGVGVVPAAPEGVRDLKQNLVGKPQRIDVCGKIVFYMAGINVAAVSKSVQRMHPHKIARSPVQSASMSTDVQYISRFARRISSFSISRMSSPMNGLR